MQNFREKVQRPHNSFGEVRNGVVLIRGTSNTMEAHAIHRACAAMLEDGRIAERQQWAASQKWTPKEGVDPEELLAEIKSQYESIRRIGHK